MAAKKGGKKAAKKGGAKKGGAKKKAPAKKPAAKKKAAKKRTPNAAFMAPKQPDAALGAVVGNNPLPRTEITKKLWAYIKKNGLQDAKERRMINADDKLKPVFGGKGKVSMFEMTKLVNKHIK
jgi:chromatin remodeling complex protein RSC6